MNHPFAYGDVVACDEDDSIAMLVTGFLYRKNNEPLIECSFWMEGNLKQEWMPLWRVGKA